MRRFLETLNAVPPDVMAEIRQQLRAARGITAFGGDQMAQIYCPQCGPIRTTMTRASAGIDIDSLPLGPIPKSRCGSCGAQLYVGPPPQKSGGMNDPRSRLVSKKWWQFWK